MTTTTSSTTSTSSTSALAALESTTTKKSSEIQTDFLSLLVTQLKNQDPLNPLDNAQMTSQLAQINTVNGIEKLNTTLQSLLSNYTNTQNMQAANLVGHTVLTPGSKLSLGSQGAIGGLTLDSAADSVIVTIKDANGNQVNTVDLGTLAAGTNNFGWDGKDSSGTALAQGSGYTFSVKASKGSTAVTATALQAGTVNAVTLDSDGMKLDLSTGAQVSYSNVKQVF